MPTSNYFLFQTVDHLELRSKDQNIKPLIIDFLAPQFNAARLQDASTQLLARALGLRRKKNPRVIDVTAGLGRDSFLMAQLGCDVTLLERSSELSQLLADGLRRLHAVKPEMGLTLIHTEALTYLQNLSASHSPDIIYLDPMYPESKKTALVKIEMRILRELVGEDRDAGELFQLALSKAKERVIVKRHRLANSISDKPPDIIFKGKTTRYDVYLLGR